MNCARGAFDCNARSGDRGRALEIVRQDIRELLLPIRGWEFHDAKVLWARLHRAGAFLPPTLVKPSGRRITGCFTLDN